MSLIVSHAFELTCAFIHLIDWGGCLPRLSDIENSLDQYARSSIIHCPSPPQKINDEPPLRSADQHIHSSAQTRAPPPATLSSTSLLNPFFGYPVLYEGLSSATPRFQHGRRRKRDLLYTLVRLWWKRWKGTIKLLLFIMLIALMAWKRSPWDVLVRKVEPRPRTRRPAALTR